MTEKYLAGYSAVTDFLNENGFTTSNSTITKICSPKINKGPPREGMWGPLPIFLPSRVLEWARERAGLTKLPDTN
jgi:hypothetical protein